MSARGEKRAGNAGTVQAGRGVYGWRAAGIQGKRRGAAGVYLRGVSGRRKHHFAGGREENGVPSRNRVSRGRGRGKRRGGRVCHACRDGRFAAEMREAGRRNGGVYEEQRGDFRFSFGAGRGKRSEKIRRVLRGAGEKQQPEPRGELFFVQCG